MKINKKKLKDLVIFPCGGNAREALTAVEAVNQVEPTWRMRGFVDEDKALKGKVRSGYKVLGGPGLLRTKFRDAYILAVPGSPKSYMARKRLIAGLKISAGRWATVVDPSVRIAADARIGRNTLILAGCYVGASVKVADHCILLPRTVVQHDTVIDDYAILGAQVTVSGNCRIGRQSYIASGSRIKDGVRVGADGMVGLGSVVLNDVAAGTVVAGCPARQIASKTRGKSHD